MTIETQVNLMDKVSGSASPAMALQMSHAILGIARMISPEDRERYGIPAVLDQRTIRNVLADQSLGKIPTDLDLIDETLQAVGAVTRWFVDNLPVKSPASSLLQSVTKNGQK